MKMERLRRTREQSQPASMRFQASIQIEQQDSTSNTKKKATLISHISWTRLGTLNLLKPARAGQTVVFNSIFQLRQRYIV